MGGSAASFFPEFPSDRFRDHLFLLAVTGLHGQLAGLVLNLVPLFHVLFSEPLRLLSTLVGYTCTAWSKASTCGSGVILAASVFRSYRHSVIFRELDAHRACTGWAKSGATAGSPLSAEGSAQHTRGES